jgi:hypothetical protein
MICFNPVGGQENHQGQYHYKHTQAKAMREAHLFQDHHTHSGVAKSFKGPAADCCTIYPTKDVPRQLGSSFHRNDWMLRYISVNLPRLPCQAKVLSCYVEM